MTRKEIENCEEEKIRTLDDFVAYCSYWDHDFSYEWKDYGWDKSGRKQINYDRSRLHMWIPFERMSILTCQVIGSGYFEDGNYPDVNIYCGGVYFEPDVIEDILEYLELTDEEIDCIFPAAEIIHSYPDLSSEQAIDAYFKRLEEIGKREQGSNEFEENDDDEQEENQ